MPGKGKGQSPLVHCPPGAYVSERNAMDTPRYACETPFERGGGLCRLCRLRPEGPEGRRCLRLVAESAGMQALLTRAAAIAGTDVSVVMMGESGAGKEVVARALHANSKRALKPFLAVNCAALPSELLESELFGHARGAFTGATSARRGLFETADGGTLLLDESAEMPRPLQAKLLRALQNGEIRRLGESESFSVDVRVVCATHQNLKAAVAKGQFRADLFFRLKVFTLQVPPLRERQADIEPLARMFLQGEEHAAGRFTKEALKLLHTYLWPGNVRELANAVKHGAVLSDGAPIDVEHLPEDMLEPVATLPSVARTNSTLAQVERDHIVAVMKSVSGRHVDAARVLGIGRTTLWRKLKAHGVDSR